MSNLENIIETAFENRAEVNFSTKGEIRDAVNETLNQLDSGKLRVCEKSGDSW